MNRNSAIQCLTDGAEIFDLVVIGGGATGLGVAVDAASRGHRVALIEQLDFAKGTSSRSTKLVHGGVRYLRQGNIPLVREALHERGLLYANAPHLVRDMRFVIPAYAFWETPFYGIGMKAYDLLAGKLNLAPSRMLGRRETIERLPTIETRGLRGGVLYHDGQFDDSRLAINLAQTAVEQGAVVANYVRAVGLIKEGGKLAGVEAEDAETGKQFLIRARTVVNATGVFVDQIRKRDEPSTKPVVTVSQGIHLVLPREFLPGDNALMIPKTADGRVLFIVPWHGELIAGTTDTPVPDVSLEPRALDEEKEFVLGHVAKYLARDPGPSDVRSIYAGLRPLVKRGNSGNTAVLSREHTILISASGLITVTGGKWTTYRKMAEDVVDRAESSGNLAKRPCRTPDLRIHGWTRNPDAEIAFQEYGADAAGIHSLIAGDASLGALLHPSLPHRRAEVVWHARNEMARTVEDVLARRTRALLLDSKASIQSAAEVASLLAGELGRPPQWEAEQVAFYRQLAAGYVFTP